MTAIPSTSSNSPAKSLSTYARNVFSQFGEDGIIERILELIPDRNHWCVEFGAWDGIFLSNTFNLIKNHGFKAVLIEPDTAKFRELQRNLETYDATLINEFVTFEGQNTLDSLLGATKIPKDFDFLSIDIDGNDYYVFESLGTYRPRLVCIEFNPSIPNEVDYVQPRDFHIKRGASALSLVNLAKSKRYELVSSSHANLMFVDALYFSHLGLENNQLENLRDDRNSRVFAFVGYDGTICLSKPLNLPWHDITVSQSRLQVLPRILRRYIGDYGVLQKILFGLFLAIDDPSRFRAELIRQARKLIG